MSSGVECLWHQPELGGLRWGRGDSRAEGRFADADEKPSAIPVYGDAAGRVVDEPLLRSSAAQRSADRLPELD